MHLVGIAKDAIPAKITNVIHNFRWARSAICKIPAMQNEIRLCLLKICENRFECGSVPVNIGHDCDAHRSRYLLAMMSLQRHC